MGSYLAVFVAAATAAGVLTPLLMAIGRRVGAMDDTLQPPGVPGRRLVARAGAVPICFAERAADDAHRQRWCRYGTDDLGENVGKALGMVIGVLLVGLIFDPTGRTLLGRSRLSPEIVQPALTEAAHRIEAREAVAR